MKFFKRFSHTIFFRISDRKGIVTFHISVLIINAFFLLAGCTNLKTRNGEDIIVYYNPATNADTQNIREYRRSPQFYVGIYIKRALKGLGIILNQQYHSDEFMINGAYDLELLVSDAEKESSDEKVTVYYTLYKNKQKITEGKINSSYITRRNMKSSMRILGNLIAERIAVAIIKDQGRI